MNNTFNVIIVSDTLSPIIKKVNIWRHHQSVWYNRFDRSDYFSSNPDVLEFLILSDNKKCAYNIKIVVLLIAILNHIALFHCFKISHLQHSIMSYIQNPRRDRLLYSINDIKHSGKDKTHWTNHLQRGVIFKHCKSYKSKFVFNYKPKTRSRARNHVDVINTLTMMIMYKIIKN